MGHRKSKIEYRDDPELIRALEETRAELGKALIEARKSQREHEAVQEFINNRVIRINIEQKTMLMGPKGIGKSTFLWLRGGKAVMKPKASCTDGTKNTINTQEIVDTIGIGISADSLMRQLALLITRSVVASSIVLFSNRPLPDLRHLRHLMIDSVTVCCLVASVTHQLNFPFYDSTMEGLLQQEGTRTIRHTDTLPNDRGLESAIDAIFPGRRVIMPDFQNIVRQDAIPLDAARSTICRYIHFLLTNDISDIAFMNAVKILV